MSKIINYINSHRNLRAFISFIIFVVWMFFTIGGNAYLFYFNKPQFAVAGILVSIMAFPTFKWAFKNIFGNS